MLRWRVAHPLGTLGTLTLRRRVKVVWQQRTYEVGNTCHICIYLNPKNVHCSALIPSSSSCLLLTCFSYCEQKAIEQCRNPKEQIPHPSKLLRQPEERINPRDGDKILKFSRKQGAIASCRRNLLINSPTNPFDISTPAYIFDLFHVCTIFQAG